VHSRELLVLVGVFPTSYDSRSLDQRLSIDFLPSWRDTFLMSSRQIARRLFMAVGIAILVLLIVPAVHVPFLVIHGPMTALRAQRAASLFILLLRASAFLFAGLLLAAPYNSKVGFSPPPLRSSTPLQLSCAWRC
jgi:hypothetical protein